MIFSENRVRFSRLFVSILLVSIGMGAAEASDGFADKSTSELETRVKEIDQQIQHLAHCTVCDGIGPIGYRTDYFNTPDQREVIRVDWGKEKLIDEVVLVPTIRRVEVNHYGAYGFPVEFKVFCGTDSSDRKTLIASYTKDDHLLPRTAPLAIQFEKTKASWVSVETSVLSPELYGEHRYILNLSEILVFSGEKDVALLADVTTTSKRVPSAPWNKGCLVDGFLPYLMDAAEGEPSPSVISELGQGDPATITIDLQGDYVVDQICLHTAEIEETVPYMFDRRFGVPRLLIVRGALNPDFSDFVPLLHFKQNSPFDVGPIITRNLPETLCRYIKLVAMIPYVPDREREGRTRFGFAEVQVFSGSKNVALHKPVKVNFDLSYFAKSTKPLTDGYNARGRILSIREWLNQLALRHDLEKERPLIVKELNRRYGVQKKQVRLLAWISGILISVTVLGIFIEKLLRQRAVIRTRERIAADIHDELGANLHAIGLLGNLANMLADSPDKQAEILSRLQDMTKRAGLAARHCINTLESKELYQDIVVDMQRTLDRLAADLDRELLFEGENLLRRLKPGKRIDFFLFYKECLANVIRHSEADRVSCRVCMTTRLLTLTVEDNGHGEEGARLRTVPNSLRRRARILGAEVSVFSPENGGTCVKLALPIKQKHLVKVH